MSLQTFGTEFGDNLLEWDAVYAKVCKHRLNVLITGNIETNFFKLNIFIERKPGNEGPLSCLPENDFNSGGTWISQNQGGTTFDSGFPFDLQFYPRTGTRKLISHERFCLLGQSPGDNSFGERESEAVEVVYDRFREP